MSDILQRATLADGDPVATLVHLLALEAGAELEEELRGLPMAELRARLQAAGTNAAELRRCDPATYVATDQSSV